MRLLSNLPLECFEPRASLAGFEIVSFGPPHRMWIDGTFHPFDVAFDPAVEGLETLFARLPPGFRPDAMLLWWPDQEPIPEGIERAPCPVVGILSDYNLSLPYVVGTWPCFDVLLVDRPGVRLFERLAFPDVRWFCQFTFKQPSHRLYPGIARDLDLGFIGNLNPIVQRERAPWIERVRALGSAGLAVEVRSGVFGAEYGRFLNRCRIAFNRSIRGEMNLRAFEAPACGAMAMLETSNEEVRDFFVPGEEVVLYDDTDFEELVRRYLRDERERARIAANGHRRVQEHRLGKRLEVLARTLQAKGPGRPAATPFDLALARGIAMLSTWADGRAAARTLATARRLAPDDPRPLNALALALLRVDARAHASQAVELLQRAAWCDTNYVPAAQNLAWILARAGHAEAKAHADQDLARRRASTSSWRDLDGPVLPFGSAAESLDYAQALRDAVAAGVPRLGLSRAP